MADKSAGGLRERGTDLARRRAAHWAGTSSFLGDLVHSADQRSQLLINSPARFVAAIGDRKMAALARNLARAFGTEVEVEVLKIMAICCGAGLLVSLVIASYGVDLSPGFF
jgi:hypothetical protein